MFPRIPFDLAVTGVTTFKSCHLFEIPGVCTMTVITLYDDKTLAE